MGMSSKHVGVLAFPFASHPGTLLRLIRRLAAAAPGVHFTFFSTPSSNRSLFSNPNNNFANIIPYDVSDGVPKDYVFSGIPLESFNLFLTVAAAVFQTGLQKAEAERGLKFTCLVTDAFLWFAADLAQHMAVPWLPLRTGGAAALSLHLHTDLIRQTLGLYGFEGRKEEIMKFIPGFSELRLGDLPDGIVFGNLESPFSIMLHKMGLTLPRAEALLINSFEELDADVVNHLNSKFKRILSIGPLSLTSPSPLSSYDQHDCIPWLANQRPKSVAYIAFGTVAALAPNELVALAEALEEMDIPFLWSLKDDLRDNLPQGFMGRSSGRGKMVAWAPQLQVLSHEAVGVFITHGGWGSVCEGIETGVPFVCKPFFGDQRVNAWMIEKVWKIGVRIEGGVFTKQAAINALELVLSPKTGETMKKHITLLKELALKAVSPEGSSTQNFKSLLQLVST